MLSEIMEIPLTFAAFKGKKEDKSARKQRSVYTYEVKHRRSLTDLVRKGRVHRERVTSSGTYRPIHCDQWLEARLGQSLHQELTSLPLPVFVHILNCYCTTWREWHALLRSNLRLEEQAASVCWAGLQCAARDIQACLLSFPSLLPVPTHAPSPETKTPTRSKAGAVAADSLVAAQMSTAAAGCGLCDDSTDSIS